MKLRERLHELRDMIRSATRKEDETVETARLVTGLVELHRTEHETHTKIIEAPDNRKCPCCGGSRCDAWRKSKHTSGCGGHNEEDKCWRYGEGDVRADGCGGDPEPLPAGVGFRQFMDWAFSRPGHHTLRYIVDNAVPPNWNPIPLATRVALWPAHWERRLGRAIQLSASRPRSVLP